MIVTQKRWRGARFARVRRRTCASGTAVCLALTGMTPPLANRVGALVRALSAARSALRRPPSAARATGARTRAWLLPGAEKFPRPVAAAKRIAADAMLTCVSTRPNGAPPNEAFKKRARTKLRTSQRAREGVPARSTATIANGILVESHSAFSLFPKRQPRTRLASSGRCPSSRGLLFCCRSQSSPS